jgi:hypothetical protein
MGLKGTLNFEVRLVTPGAVKIACPMGCYNWGKNMLGIPDGILDGWLVKHPHFTN